MSIKLEIADLVNKIFNSKNDSLSLSYCSHFLNELKEYDFEDILVYLISNPKILIEDILYFILSTPSLWIKYSHKEWMEIMITLNPRPNPFSREIFDKGYVDIHFLCKYLKINGIKMFLDRKDFDDQDKKRLLQYSKKITPFLFMDELDVEDLDGEYLVDINVLDAARLKLTDSKKIEVLNFNESELKQYIDKELKERFSTTPIS